MPATRLFLSMPKAEIRPRIIGVKQATRAEAVGMKKASTAMTTMVPMSRRLRLVPSSEITLKARRRSSPVIAMAAAITSDAAISATAGLVNPSSVTDSAAPVPSARSGCAGSGANPSRKAIKAISMIELAAYSTASVIQIMTAKANMPSMCCPATESPAGCGMAMMAASAAMPTRRPQNFIDVFCVPADLAPDDAAPGRDGVLGIRHQLPLRRLRPPLSSRDCAQRCSLQATGRSVS